VTKSVSDSDTTIRYSWWVPIAILAAGIVCIPIGIAMRKNQALIAWGLMILGPIAALLFGPSMLLERINVTDRGFDVHSGILGMTANQDIAFDGVAMIRIGQEETGGSNSRLIDVLYFDMKNGGSGRFPLNNDVKIEAGKEIVARAMMRGIAVVDK
jgi:hypothetical protein